MNQPKQFPAAAGGGGVKPIGDVVAELIARRGYARVQESRRLETAWEQAAGAATAAETRAGQVRRGVLEVVVRNSMLLQELTFRKRQLVKELARLAPEAAIRDVRFRIGAVS